MKMVEYLVRLLRGNRVCGKAYLTESEIELTRRRGYKVKVVALA
jgi:hypothetical protein